MVFHHLVVAHAGRTKMQSEDAGFSASSLSAHERYWVDTPARGCLKVPGIFLCLCPGAKISYPVCLLVWAVVQATPVMFQKEKCVEKVLKLMEECAANGAQLIVFPELFIPGYPYGMTYGSTVGSRNQAGREDWKVYYDNSILAKGTEMQQIIDCAKRLGVYVSIGYSGRDEVTATLYNSNMMISPQGEALNHRKLKPTGSERVVWGDGNKDFFPVMDTPWGPMGNLICWESYMPLARVALYQKGITIYISPNTNDNPEWQDTIRHIAIEGHCFFINCDMYFTKADYPKT